MRLTIYSHDTYGLGNIRRMLEICKYFLKTLSNCSILLISGSPLLHSFRLPKGLDYIKIPCIGRDLEGELSAQYLKIDTDETLELRSQIIRTAIINFKPDLLLVDKKPYALKGELKDTLEYLEKFLPKTKVVLLLRDILDAPEKTISEWQENQYYQGIERYYDRIQVVGMQEIFDVTKEYQFPSNIAKKVKFCGYIRRESGIKTADILRQELQVKSNEKIVLVTAGGGADGYKLIDNYLKGIERNKLQNNIKNIIISGPEMPLEQREQLKKNAANNPKIKIIEFTDDLNSYMEAADLVVAMGGYNTICEILSLNKKAVIIPRIKPVKEQWIRTTRMAKLGLFKAIHPELLTPENMMQAVLEQLNQKRPPISNIERIVDLDALPRIKEDISFLLGLDNNHNLSGLGNFCKRAKFFPKIEKIS
ncbi:MAG: glycosyltransferase [Prochloraceae cyanobacterium]|nr:glycosyltransferase [Prochloraceae cyanobacterium]